MHRRYTLNKIRIFPVPIFAKLLCVRSKIPASQSIDDKARSRGNRQKIFYRRFNVMDYNQIDGSEYATQKQIILECLSIDVAYIFHSNKMKNYMSNITNQKIILRQIYAF